MRLRTRLLLAACGILGYVACQAEVLDKIKATQTINMGVRSDNGGLSYAISDGVYGGFHVDLCRRIIQDMQAQFKKDIQINYVPVSGQSRIPKMVNGEIDIECGATTNNESRQKFVAFAITTYVEEVRVAVKAQSPITSVDQLNGKKLATTFGTTSLSLILKQQRASKPNIEQVLARTDAESFDLMASGKADAYVMDGQILAAFISSTKQPEDFRLLKEVLSVEPIAIMLPAHSPALKKFVDNSLITLMQSGEIETIYNQWFLEPIPPKQIPIGLPVSDATRKAWAAPNDRPAQAY